MNQLLSRLAGFPGVIHPPGAIGKEIGELTDAEMGEQEEGKDGGYFIHGGVYQYSNDWDTGSGVSMHLSVEHRKSLSR